jgi:hypothetical protein
MLAGKGLITLKHVRCRVKMQNNLLKQSETLVGLRQEDTPTCILFNLALEKVMKDSEIEIKGTIYKKYPDMCLCR